MPINYEFSLLNSVVRSFDFSSQSQSTGKDVTDFVEFGPVDFMTLS